MAAALAWALLVAVAAGEPAPLPTLSEVLTCQPEPSNPSLALSLSLDGLGLFWFRFPSSSWLPAGPALPPWPPALERPRDVLPEAQICRRVLEQVGPRVEGMLPEASGTPTVSVFPALPPLPGRPNALLCVVEDVFPPALDISWRSAGATVARGVTLGPFLAGPRLSFARVARVDVVPRAGHVHACVVTWGRDNASVVAYWVAPDTALDEQLDTELAGAALALGIVLALLGLGLALLARRHRPG